VPRVNRFARRGNRQPGEPGGVHSRAMPEPAQRPTPEQLARYAEAFSNSTALQAFGVRLHFPSADKVVAVIDPILPLQRGKENSS